MWAEAAVTTASASNPASASAILKREPRTPIRAVSLLGGGRNRQGLPLSLEHGPGGGHPGDRDPVGRAAHVVEARELEEGDRVGVASMLAADPQLQVRLGLPPRPRGQPYEPAHSRPVDGLERAAVEDLV